MTLAFSFLTIISSLLLFPTSAHAKQFVVRLNGKVVNLSELYSLILECGGSFKVNQINLWDEIYCRLFKYV